MAITLARAKHHIAYWKNQLSGSHSFWPSYIFHTADVTVIPAILRSGHISCRANQASIVCDVAAQEPLWRNPSAHNYARFYFRPKTLFHVVKEGIRAIRDTRRTPTQMSIPVIIVFDALSCLTKEDAIYTKEKYANASAEIGTTEQFFDSIDFAGVYHNSGTQDQSVRHKRMAEILFPSSLPLQNNYKCIVCRTAYDRITLLSFLTPEEQIAWGNTIIIEQVSGTFFVHDYSLYIKKVTFSSGVLSLSLKHPSQVGIGDYKANITQYFNGQVLHNVQCEIPLSYDPVNISGFKHQENCTWHIVLEDVLAFYGVIPSDSSSLV